MKPIICLALFCLTATTQCSAQSKAPSKAYVTSGGELIFSFASIQQNDANGGSKLRFSPAVNFQVMLNKDVSKNFGLFTGLALRNVGYIMDDYKDTANHIYKKKFRSYNIGIPVGIKVGNLERTFFYAGYEASFLFRTKRKPLIMVTRSIRSLDGSATGRRLSSMVFLWVYNFRTPPTLSLNIT